MCATRWEVYGPGQVLLSRSSDTLKEYSRVHTTTTSEVCTHYQAVSPPRYGLHCDRLGPAMSGTPQTLSRATAWVR